MCEIHADNLTLPKLMNIFSTTTAFVFRHGCLRNEKLLTASDLVHFPTQHFLYAQGGSQQETKEPQKELKKKNLDVTS